MPHAFELFLFFNQRWENGAIGHALHTVNGGLWFLSALENGMNGGRTKKKQQNSEGPSLSMVGRCQSHRRTIFT